MHVTPQKCVTGVQTKPTGPRRPLGFSPCYAALAGCVLLDAVAARNNSTHSPGRKKSKLKRERETKRRNANALVTSYGTHLTCYLTQLQQMS